MNGATETRVTQLEAQVAQLQADNAAMVEQLDQMRRLIRGAGATLAALFPDPE